MIQITLDLPPSLNHAWVIRRRGRKTYMALSDEAQAYRQAMQLYLNSLQIDPLAGRVAVSLDVYFGRHGADLDNRIKAALDCMKHILFGDDSDVVELHARKFYDKRNPRLEVTIRQAE